MMRQHDSCVRWPWLRWSQDSDEAEVVRPTEFIAGTWNEIEIAIAIKGRPLKAGERLGLGVPFGFPPPRLADPRAETYTTAAAPEGVQLSLSPMEGREHFIWIAVTDGALNPGDSILVRCGDRRHGSPGVLTPRQAMHDMLLPCFRESHRPALLPDSPRLSVKPGPFAALRAHLPAVARPGERVRLRVVAQDAHGNCPPVSPRIAVLNRAAAPHLPETLDLEDGKGHFDFTAPQSGVIRIALRDAGVETVSNPMEITDAGDRLYFGDIHVHTELSYDAGGEINEMYQYARDLAGLDFAAAADHQTAVRGPDSVFGHAGGIPGVGYDSTPARWETTCDAAARSHDPGRFITLVGFEFAPHEFAGHRNVYWLEDRPHMLATNGSLRQWLATRPLERLTQEQQVLVIPHHPPIMWRAGVEQGGGLVYGDLPDVAQPVLEICSKHGTSEYLNNERPLRGQCTGSFVSDFLDAGHRFGFIGGSDTHLANPGSPLREGPYSTLRFRAGLAAVWAPELTRKGIWDALWTRRCYATTGAKIGLRFRVGHLLMGEEGVVQDPRLITIEAHGEQPIILIEIVRNGAVIARWDPHRPQLDVAFEYQDADDARRETDYYYARVRQHDGERAWSSPIWVSS